MQASFSQKVKFIVKIGKALHHYGTNAPRLEVALKEVSKSLNLYGHFFASPTYLSIAIDDENEDEQTTRNLRVLPGDVDLGKLSDVDDIASYVSQNKISVEEGINQLNILTQKKSLYSGWIVLIALAILSSSLTVLLGGNEYDFSAAFILGGITGLINILKNKFDRIQDLYEFITALVITFISFMAATFFPSLNLQTVILASLIAIIPGLSFTISLMELAQKNLVAGTARLTGTIIDFFKISIGVIVGLELGTKVFGPVDFRSALEINYWYYPALVFFISIAFAILFQAHKKDFKWVFLSVALSLGSYKLAGLYFPSILCSALAACVVGMLSNAFAEKLNRPALIPLFPGLIILVPGAIGFTGLNLIYSQQYTEGLQSTFNMITIAFSLILGLFFANVFIKPRKAI